MKPISLPKGRFAMKGVAVAALAAALCGPNAAWALGLGRVNVMSALGEALRAEIDVTSMTPDEAASLVAKVASPETYRAAGVEYNAALATATVSLQRRSDGSPYLRVSSNRPVQEPFVDIILDLNWSTGKLVREYTMLFDPPRTAAAAAPAPAPTPAQTAAAPRPAPRAEASPSTPPLPPSRPAATSSAPAPKPAPRPAAPEPQADQPAQDYRVRPGDTLTAIASRNQRRGASLDQMLVSIYRNNQQAFIENNMNLLRSGAVLSIPSAEEAKSVSRGEARQVIQAQAADFSEYRRRLAGAVGTAKAPERTQATGQVQTEVQDRQPSAAASDKLTLDKGRTAGGKPALEERVAQAREEQEKANRVNELAKNVDELRKLQAASSAAGLAPPKVSAPASSPVVVAQAPIGSLPEPAKAEATAAPAAEPAPPPPAVVPPPAPAEASASSVTAPGTAGEAVPASAPEPAPTEAAASAVPPAPEPEQAKPPAPAPQEEEPGFVAGLLENPWALPVAGLLAVALAGLGWMRLRGQKKGDGGETSFLESRLQPDSFFGASGGQRVDTHDATGASSSMSYSLSQLDAIGDVDPVAEADVYLAYGRDLQAEEILKEAMRADPQRLAIRTKLLEVYAKRRDAKGFELLATQMYGLTGGQGEEWGKAQELGRGIDPENSLYQPGGAPSQEAAAANAAGSEMLGVSTMPQSVVPSPSRYEMGNSGMDSAGAPLSQPGVDVDLDLDLGLDGGGAMEGEPSVMTASGPDSSLSMPDAPNTEPPQDYAPFAETAPPIASDFSNSKTGELDAGSKEFDLGGLSLDLDSDATIAIRQPEGAAPGPVGLDSLPSLERLDLPAGEDASDPLLRKLELADEFRQIGDVEGARDLLQEVVEKSNGVLKSKAQGMLDALS